MQPDRLESIIASLEMRERLQRVNSAAQRFFTPLAAAAALACGAYNAPDDSAQYAAAEQQGLYQVERRAYGHEDTFYVHIPSWVHVRKVPAHVTGPHLYGYTFPATGDAFVRDDLFDDHASGELRESEVTLHEVLHNLYPSAHEQEIRSHVRSILGARAVIHSRLG